MTNHYDNIPSSSTQPGYKKTKLGWLPVEWEVSNVGKAFNICNSGRKPLSSHVRQQMQGVYPYYGPTKIQDFIDEYQYEGAYALIAEDGDHFLKYADKRMTQLANGQFNVNNHAHVIEGKNKKSTTEWFYWFFYHRNIFSHLTRQGAGRYKLNKAALSKLPVALPPLPEQQKIATILSTWDRAITLTRQLLQEKEAQKKGLMQRLLTGKVRVKGFANEFGFKKTVIGNVPKDWSVKKAGKVFKSVSTKRNGQKPLLAVTQENGVIDRNDLEGRVTMPSGSTDSYKLVQPGNFVISLRSFQGGLEYSTIEGIVSPAYIVLENIIGIDTQYFRYYFKSTEFILRLAVAVIGIRDGKQISYKDFSALNLRLPPLKEQTAIAAILTQADEEIRLLREKERALQAQKKGLMQRLLTGKVRVNP